MSPENRATPVHKKTKRLRGWLFNGVLILLVFAGVQWWQGRSLITGEAPPLTGVTLDGRLLDLAGLRGRPVLVYFWASWCPVCKVTDGAIDGIARDHPVITVALQSGDADEIRHFLRQSRLDFPVIPDPDGRIAGRWRVRGVPVTFVVDAVGQIRYATVGASTGPGQRFRLWLAAHWDSGRSADQGRDSAHRVAR